MINIGIDFFREAKSYIKLCNDILIKYLYLLVEEQKTFDMLQGKHVFYFVLQEMLKWRFPRAETDCL